MYSKTLICVQRLCRIEIIPVYTLCRFHYIFLSLFPRLLPYIAGASPGTTPATPTAPPVTEHKTPPVVIHTERNFFPPKRPDYGKLGRKIPLLVNFFPLEIRCGEILQYDVKAFTEEMIARKG